MEIKYRVNYYESESGWGSDSWNTDYDTEQEARDAYQDCYTCSDEHFVDKI